MEATAFLSRFFPDTTSLRLDSWHLDDMATLMTLQVTSTQTAVSCPGCAAVAQRVHSRYRRTLADLPWGTWRITWQLRVRKFFCDNPACPRQIFTERLPDVAVP
jgi:transposase